MFREGRSAGDVEVEDEDEGESEGEGEDEDEENHAQRARSRSTASRYMNIWPAQSDREIREEVHPSSSELSASASTSPSASDPTPTPHAPSSPPSRPSGPGAPLSGLRRLGRRAGRRWLRGVDYSPAAWRSRCRRLRLAGRNGLVEDEMAAARIDSDGDRKRQQLAVRARRQRAVRQWEREYELFLVQWRGQSNIHCEWVRRGAIEQISGGLERLRRFLKPKPFEELKVDKYNARATEARRLRQQEREQEESEKRQLEQSCASAASASKESRLRELGAYVLMEHCTVERVVVSQLRDLPPAAVSIFDAVRPVGGTTVIVAHVSRGC